MKRREALSATAHIVTEALNQPGCAICRVSEDAGRSYLEALFYEMVNDPGVRTGLRASRGFCRRHAEAGNRVENALGAAIIHRDLLRQFRRALDARLAAVPESNGIVNWLIRAHRARTAVGPCPVCETSAAAEERAIAGLLEGLEQRALSEPLERSDGFCVKHTGQVRAACHDGATWAQIVAVERRVVDTLMSNLDEFIRKHDYRFANEPSSEAEAAAKRLAIEMVSTLCRLDTRQGG